MSESLVKRNRQKVEEISDEDSDENETKSMESNRLHVSCS